MSEISLEKYHFRNYIQYQIEQVVRLFTEFSWLSLTRSTNTRPYGKERCRVLRVRRRSVQRKEKQCEY